MIRDRNILITSLFGLLLAGCAVVAFLALFSNFRSYDDEGLLLLSSRLFLEGHAFYTEIPWIYGPFYLAIVQLLHDCMGIPLTHSAVRFVTLFWWLLLAATAAGLVARLTRSRLWAAIAMVLAFLFVGSVVNEPGHPQSMVAFGALLIPLLACCFDDDHQRSLWLALGLLVGFIFHIKMNAGVFCLAAVAIVLAGNYPARRWGRPLRLLMVSASFALPFVLMFPLLSQPYAAAFAALLGLSAGAVAVVLGSRHGSRPRPGGVTSLAFAAGFTVSTSLALIYASLFDASAADILASLLSYSSSQVDYYHFFRTYTWVQLALAGLSFSLALSTLWRNNLLADSWQIILGKLYLVSGAGYALMIDSPAHSQAMFAYAGPWCWALVYARGQDKQPQARMLLAAVAVFSPLLAYPIPGSQMYFGALPILLAAMVCAVDLLRQLGISRPSTQLAQATTAFSCLVLFVACSLLYTEYLTVRTQFDKYKPLALPGTGLLRIEPERARVLRELVAVVNDADVVFTTFRFNSLYLWTTAAMPDPDYLSHAPLAYSEAGDLQDLQAGLLRAENPIIVTRGSSMAKDRWGAITPWIDQHFERFSQIGSYVLLKKRAVSPGAAR